MSKYCDDFTYKNKTLSSLSYIVVKFNYDDTIPLALGRNVKKGEPNKYKKTSNHTGTEYSNVLEFDLHITKDPDTYPTQAEMEITRDDLRKITAWLSSPTLPQWLDIKNGQETQRYKGLFTNIDTFCVGELFGLKLTFTCDSPYAYSNTIEHSLVSAGYAPITIHNGSDELESYVFPAILITPSETGQIFIHNRSDCTELKTDPETDSITALKNKIDEYALLHGMACEYYYVDHDGEPVLKTLCGDRAIQFILTDAYAQPQKCTAYLLPDGGCRIFKGGFLYLKVLRDLPITVNCQSHSIYDGLGRPVLFDALGISDVDEMHWTRFVNGDNQLIVYGNAAFTFRHLEERKVGAL